jgi:hypothetical protein
MFFISDRAHATNAKNPKEVILTAPVPLPVTGEMQVTGVPNVNVPNNVNTTVTNDATNPVPVALDTGAPFLKGAVIVLDIGKGISAFEEILPEVPAGKVFILKDVNVGVNDQKGPGVNFKIIVFVSQPGVFVTHGDVEVPTLTTKGSFGSGGSDGFSSPVYIPVEAGRNIEWRAVRDDATAPAGIGLTISGVFMDVE